MRFESARRTRRGIGLTPLVDVVFLLLIFFMLASSFSRETVWTIGIANAAAGAPAEHDAPLRVGLHSEGRTTLDDREIAPGEVAAAVAERLLAEPDRSIWVVPDDDIPLQRIATALEQLKAAGGRNVTLAGRRRDR